MYSDSSSLSRPSSPATCLGTGDGLRRSRAGLKIKGAACERELTKNNGRRKYLDRQNTTNGYIGAAGKLPVPGGSATYLIAME